MSVLCPVCDGLSSSFGVKRGAEMYRCSACRSLFVWPVPDNVLDTYSADYFSGGTGHGYVDYDADKMPMIHTFEKYLDLLAQAGTPSGRLLDVGAATGFFLDLARKRGFEPVGIELAEAAVEKARRKGLNVICGTLEQLPDPPESFDAITMLDVLEHLSAPQQDLARVHQLLRRDGLLVINTPDAGSWTARLLGLRWHLITPPEHLCLFTGNALVAALKKSGFEVLMVRCIGKKFTLSYVAQTLANNHKFVVWDAAVRFLRSSGLGHFGIPINLRDNVFVLARKT